MKRLTALALLLFAPATASASTLEELPFKSMPDRSAAGCLRATGVPGEIAMLGPYSRQRSAIDVLAVTGSGAEQRERLELGRLFECPAVAADPSGAAIVAGMTLEGRFDAEMRAAPREPGGAFMAPLTIGRIAASPAVAVDPSGGSVLAWVTAAGKTGRIRLVRRAPGGGFGPAVTISRFEVGEFPSIDLVAGIDGAGNATLLWARELPSKEPNVAGPAEVEVATVPPSSAPTVQRLARAGSYDVRPRLAVARGGAAIAVFESNRNRVPAVFERPAGGTFARVALGAGPKDRPYRTAPAVALGEDGGAVIAWRAGTFDSTSGIEAVTRAAGGEFGPVSTVAPPPPLRYYGSGEGWLAVNPFDLRSGPPVDDDSELAALSDDGRVLLGWRGTAGNMPLQTSVAHAATGRLGGAFDAPQTLGAPMRRTTGLAPLFLADGRAALAWSDNAGFARDGRLHVAVEGAVPRPAAPTPRLTIEAPSSQRLYALQSVRLTARCDSACDLRAAVRGRHGPGDAVTATLLKAGTIRLRPIHEQAGRSRIVVQATAPGGHRTVERTLRIRIARRPSPPIQSPTDVRVRRDGDAIVVNWRTSGPAKRQSFTVVGVRKRRDLDTLVIGAFASVEGRGRRRHSVRLHAQRPERVRWVGVFAYGDGGEDGERLRFVRVR